jgi:hypothetical protein
LKLLRQSAYSGATPPSAVQTRQHVTLRHSTPTCSLRPPFTYVFMLRATTVSQPVSPAKSESPMISLDIPNGVFRSYAGSQRPYSAAPTFPPQQCTTDKCFPALSCALKRVDWHSVRHMAVPNTDAGFQRLFLISRFAFLKHSSTSLTLT